MGLAIGSQMLARQMSASDKMAQGADKFRDAAQQRKHDAQRRGAEDKRRAVEAKADAAPWKVAAMIGVGVAGVLASPVGGVLLAAGAIVGAVSGIIGVTAEAVSNNAAADHELAASGEELQVEVAAEKAEFHKSLAGEDVTFLEGRCSPYGAAVAYRVSASLSQNNGVYRSVLLDLEGEEGLEGPTDALHILEAYVPSPCHNLSDTVP